MQDPWHNLTPRLTHRGWEGKKISSPSRRGRKMSLTSPLIDRGRKMSLTSPLIDRDFSPMGALDSLCYSSLFRLVGRWRFFLCRLRLAFFLFCSFRASCESVL